MENIFLIEAMLLLRLYPTLFSHLYIFFHIDKILNYLRTGVLILPPHITKKMIKQELDFWQIPRDVVKEEEKLGTDIPISLSIPFLFLFLYLKIIYFLTYVLKEIN